jgi:hypothetical protein
MARIRHKARQFQQEAGVEVTPHGGSFGKREGFQRPRPGLIGSAIGRNGPSSKT